MGAIARDKHTFDFSSLALIWDINIATGVMSRAITNFGFLHQRILAFMCIFAHSYDHAVVTLVSIVVHVIIYSHVSCISSFMLK